MAFARVASRFAPHLRRRRGRVVRAALLALAYPLVRILEPWPLKLVFDAVLLDHPLPAFAARIPGIGGDRLLLLYALAGAIVLLALVSGLLYYLQRLHGSLVAQELAADLRLDLYGHIQRLSFAFHDRRRTGDLIVRLTGDVRMLREALFTLPLELAEHVLLLVGMAAVMAWMDWQLALAAMVLVPAIAALIRRYRRPMKQALRKQREREGHLATLATEALGAIRVVQGLRRERDEIRRFGGENRRSLRSGVRAARLEARFRWSADVAVAVVTAGVVTWAARRVLAGALTPGDLVVFVTYLRTFARPVRRTSRLLERMMRAAAAGERVLEILDTESSVREREDAVAAPRLRGEIRFENVSFSYRGRHTVLDDVSLRIAPGERVALVGATGSGKSTLLSLIPRFYDPSSGRILLDGLDVRTLTLTSIRRQIALVFQEPVLFACSIAENIAYGRRNATQEDVRSAARRAGIDDVISRLPQGYDTVTGERGGTLSGGQRQCVAIARAMIRNAPIVLLDEPTTGLDPASAELVMEAIQRLVEGRTVIAISHHVQSLRGTDRILRLESGRVREDSDAPLAEVARR